MKSFLVLSLAASVLAWPTPEEIFARATTTQFCKKVKTGCGASLEKNSVQKYCESVLGVPPQKTKTFTNIEWETYVNISSCVCYRNLIRSLTASGHPPRQKCKHNTLELELDHLQRPHRHKPRLSQPLMPSKSDAYHFQHQTVQLTLIFPGQRLSWRPSRPRPTSTHHNAALKLLLESARLLNQHA